MDKIVVVGLGYVGLSNAVLLAQYNDVIGVDICQDRVNALNEGQSPIIDAEIEDYLLNRQLNISATSNLKEAVHNADYILVATPTNYNETTNKFDTTSVEEVISQIFMLKSNAYIIIKSTIPVGFVDLLRKRFKTDSIVFSPEFLREGKALYDNLYPSRIVIGDHSKRAEKFTLLLQKAAIREDIDILYTGTQEAEAIKLFSNTYLAMRVAFFNELDSYAYVRELNSKDIIDGVSLDPRIGDHYNNPSFGYGGYCLPKDTKQLLANYDNIPQNLVGAIVEANATRKRFLADEIVKLEVKTVGIYRLAMKAGSDNFRESAIQDIMLQIKSAGVDVVLYEPDLSQNLFGNIRVENNLDNFKNNVDIIIANRVTEDLLDYPRKIFSRDIFGIN